jgi:hypothetical protein
MLLATWAYQLARTRPLSKDLQDDWPWKEALPRLGAPNRVQQPRAKRSLERKQLSGVDLRWSESLEMVIYCG